MPTANHLQSFVKQFPLVAYPPGEFLFRLQKTPDSFLMIKSGCIKVSQTTLSGDSVTIHVLFEGSCVSLLSLIDTRATYEFETLTDTEVYRIPRAQFIEYLQSTAEVSYHFLLQTLKGLDGLVFRIRQDSSEPAYERVASLLLYFVKHLGSVGEKPVIQLSITHQDISEWLGLTRENVSIQMKKLEKAGFIGRKDRLIEIVNLPGLKKVAE